MSTDANAMSCEHLFAEHLLNKEEILWYGIPEKNIQGKDWRKSWRNILISPASAGK
jgi:hypothetical protein